MSYGYFSKFSGIVGGAGHKVPAGAATFPEFSRECGVDFEVIKRPVIAVIDAEQAVPIPNRFATLRSDSMEPLGGIVTDSYKIVQSEKVFELPDELARRGQLTYTRCGSLNGGGIVFAVATLGASEITDLTGRKDAIEHNAIFATGHEGRTGMFGVLSSTRLCCVNQFPALKNAGKIFTIPHCGTAEERLERAQALLLNVNQTIIDEMRFAQALANKPMTGGEFKAFAVELLDDVRGTIEGKDEEAERKRERRDNVIEDLCGYFGGGLGNSGKSAWDGFNSITEWLDHKLARNDSESDSRYEKMFKSSVLDGHSGRTKVRAARMLTR